MRELRIFEESVALYREAADRIAQAAHRAMAADGRFTLLLAGGATPRRLYALLGSAEYGPRIDWSRTHLFWGDERAVPVSDPQNAFRMVAETLLSRVYVPEENVHQVKTDLPPEQAAEQYEQELVGFFGGPPAFHVVLLGMGADGHTASLFPGMEALREEKRLVVATSNTVPQRITFTFPALNRAQQVMFLVTGAAKAPALAAALEGPFDPDLPAALVKPASGRIAWLVDEAAASLLSRRTLE